MNILVPMSWLGEYLQTDLAPAEIARWGALHGPSFEHILEREGEAVFDIEITTNRVDAMCIKGLARELAAILGDQAAAPRLHETVTVDLPVQTKKTLPVPEIVVETEAVNKIMCVVLDKVANVASPARVQKRLRQIEQGFNRLPLRDRRGEFLSGVSENLFKVVSRTAAIEIRRRLRLILKVKRQLVEVVNVR